MCCRSVALTTTGLNQQVQRERGRHFLRRDRSAYTMWRWTASRIHRNHPAYPLSSGCDNAVDVVRSDGVSAINRRV